jgi:hypothetical protein
MAAEGWPEWLNTPSKVGQVAAVRILARKRGEVIYATGWSSRLRARA